MVKLIFLVPNCGDWKNSALLLCPCLFCPSDNAWSSRCADAPRCTQFSTVISPSWITEQISVGKCMHRGASVRRERQICFKIVTWKKQTWTKHHNTANKEKPHEEVISRSQKKRLSIYLQHWPDDIIQYCCIWDFAVGFYVNGEVSLS